MKKVVLISLAYLILITAALFVGAYFFDREFKGTKNDNEYAFETVEENNNINNNYSLFSPDDKNVTITVGLYNSGYLYHEDHDHGVSKDTVEELFRRMNIKHEFVVMPRVRISSMIEDGLLPMSVSTIKTPEREKYGWFVPYFAEKNYVLIREDIEISNEADLLASKYVKVGIVRGYYYGEYYMKLIEKLKEKRVIVEAKNIDELFKMLKEDWIQVTFNNPASYLYFFDHRDIKDVKIVDFAPDEAPLVRCLIFSKKYFTEDYVKEIEKVISEMKADGTLLRIFETYFPEEDAKKACDY